MAERSVAEQVAQWRRENQGKAYAARRDKYVPKLRELAKKYGTDPYLTEAIIYKESRFNPNAYNPNDPDGARGLPQFIAATGKAYGLNKTNAFDPDTSLDAQARFIRDNFKASKGDPLKATRRYNRATNYAESALAIADELRAMEGQRPTTKPAPVQTAQEPQEPQEPQDDFNLMNQLRQYFNISQQNTVPAMAGQQPMVAMTPYGASIPEYAPQQMQQNVVIPQYTAYNLPNTKPWEQNLPWLPLT